MTLDILTFGEALVEVMRTEIGQPLDRPGSFTGPYPSGAPFIFAVQAARLGAKVAAIGCVGADAFGKCLIDQLDADGVDGRGVRTLSGHTTGVAFVAYEPDGSRDFVFHVSGAAAGQISPGLLDKKLFAGLRCLHLMGSTLSIHEDALETGKRALEMARHAGAKISFDPNLRPQLMPNARAREAFQPFMDAADVIIPTAEEIMLLTATSSVDEAARKLLFGKRGKPDRIVVVTGGAAGCTIYRSAEPGAKFRHDLLVEPMPGFPVAEVDPTGAGDCFDAGFLVRWLAGHPPAAAASFANACGALAVTAQGPMAGAKKLVEVEAFIQERKPDV
jgi:fructokinase